MSANAGRYVWVAGGVASVLCFGAGWGGSLAAGAVAAAVGGGLTVVLGVMALKADKATKEAATKTQEATAALEGRFTSLQHAVAGAGHALLICDKDGVVVSGSEGAARMFGTSSSRLTGGMVGEIMTGRKGGSLMDKVLGAGQAVNGEETLTLPSGKTLDVLASVVPLQDKQGKVVGAVGSFADMAAIRAEQKAMEAQQQTLVETGGTVSELAQRVASASEELSASASEQSRGAHNQKAQSETVATAMEEMTATVLEVAQNAAATSSAADEAQVSARDGVDLVDQAVAGINQVSKSTHELSQGISQLELQAGEIGRIINVINDIADQTNLLALNAAIEAARAGDAGRGFAVVADEVRKLAEKTMQATKEVEDAVRSIQNGTQAVMQSMELTETQVKDSTELSNRAGEALQQIMANIEDMVMRVSQIATAAEEQSSAAEEINQSIEEIAVIAREAEDGAEQAASATRELAELSQNLLTVSMEFSGQGMDNDKLWPSKGQMRGVLPKLMQNFVRGEYGEDAFNKMQNKMGDPIFLPTANYPDKVLHQMGAELEDVAGIKSRDVHLGFGDYTIDQFYKLYRRYFKTTDLKELYLSMDGIHKQLTKDYPGINPPSFTYEDKGNKLIMTYKSSRGLFNYFEGILRGAARFCGQKVKISVKPLSETSARAEIIFMD